MNPIKPSLIHTLHFQKSLPRLAVPDLNETCAKYIKAVSPLLTQTQLEETKRVVEQFRTKEGVSLQAALVEEDRRNPHTSYISKYWSEMYLKDRNPLYASSGTLLFRQDPSKNTQVYRAACMIRASLDFRELLKARTLPPHVFHTKDVTQTEWYQRMAAAAPQAISSYVMMAQGAYPLDMSQYRNLFNSTRIPRKGMDELRVTDSDHMVVFCKGRPFKLNVYESVTTGTRTTKRALSEHQIAARLDAIVAMAKESPEFPVCALTSLNRDTWASLRAEMEESEMNRTSLHTIDSAIFTVSLDDEDLDWSPEGMDYVEECLMGSLQKQNKWFDKSFTMSVSKNGWLAISLEHSWGDGVPLSRFACDQWHATAAKTGARQFEEPTVVPAELCFELSDNVKRGITGSRVAIAKYIAPLSVGVAFYGEGFGKKAIRDLGFSPDGFVQLAMQLAVKRLYGETFSTYESANNAAFKGGRTETIRVASEESSDFCSAVLNSKHTATELCEMLQAAVKKHGKLAMDAMTGNGVDRHLFAICKTAERLGVQVPALFQDTGYVTPTPNVLHTTATITSRHLDSFKQFTTGTPR